MSNDKEFESAWLSATDYFTVSRCAAKFIWDAALRMARQATPASASEAVDGQAVQRWINELKDANRFNVHGMNASETHLRVCWIEEALRAGGVL